MMLLSLLVHLAFHMQSQGLSISQKAKFEFVYSIMHRDANMYARC